ncbi:GAF domain-containing protein [Leptolyngbya sp. FACHB-671]|uniref:DICT sensory domain-containing protein n=1 Tax=Leptolyngbya sp. FACHB-671 TaxID=2692812 RepID=UPI001682A54B|nr:DICT sensory domain-containing protein [Leptolyngbya sp. FACHB-671]MBD2069723.1 GAF domain-containing protein [Leptolyngbya sp. FACHB-671]
MSIAISVLEELLQRIPRLRSQLYFKSSLTALSHAMEDQVLAGLNRPLVIASFQRERFYRQESHRYLRIAELTPQVYVLAAPETSFTNASQGYETIAFEPDDQLSQEWHLVVIGQQYATCLICRERKVAVVDAESAEPMPMDQTRRFEGIWTFDRQVSCTAASLLLDRVLEYRPELAAKVQQAKQEYLTEEVSSGLQGVDPDPFVQRLVTYLQAGQYKLLKAYRSISAQERKERLVNSITAAIRRSLDPEEIFTVAVQELGQAMDVCRCILYRCKPADTSVTVQHEFLAAPTLRSLSNQTLSLQDNPLFQVVAQKREPVSVTDTQQETNYDLTPLKDWIDRWQIRSWVMVPIVYQGRLMGMVELQGCAPEPHPWEEDDIAMVEAIATQLGVALIQAESYANLEDLNQQLEALERTRSNLIAITGHELRTPLSTIQVCLESLASEPDMPLELRQVMLSSALTDAERMRKLVQDFLTLSRLESGRVEWHLEPLALDECVDLALSSIRTRKTKEHLPDIEAQVPVELPLVRADGEWLVEVLSKLLDNACKFTEPEGQVLIQAKPNGGDMLEVTITDTGRGIEPNRLEVVFDRFYQEEGALRRTAGGTGLGLAICRQIILGLGGKIWAESAGRDQGSQFHFTIPIAKDNSEVAPNTRALIRPPVTSKNRRGRSRATLR